MTKAACYRSIEIVVYLTPLRFLVDLPASRNSAVTLLGFYRQADVLSISTNISLTSMIEKYRFTLCFYISRRQLKNNVRSGN